MKPLIEKILKSGLIDKNTAKMFERWGTLGPEVTDLVEKEKVTKETLNEFVEQISELLDAEQAVMRETRLEVQVRPPVSIYCPRLGADFSGVEDQMGRYIIGPYKKVIPGDVLFINVGGERGELQHLNKTDASYVQDVEEIYDGDKLVGLQITV